MHFQKDFPRAIQELLVIGSDCPAVTSDLIIEALHRLNRRDVVIGPVTDGGYYLVGLCLSVPKLFAGINWSTELVLEQTIERCNTLRLTHVLLPELHDIDRMEDLEYYRKQGMVFDYEAAPHFCHYSCP